MPKKRSRAETVAFAAAAMKKNHDVEMADLKKLGKKRGFNVYPLIMGLARKELGLSRSKRKAKAGRRRGPGRPPGRRGPGRPPRRRGPGRPPGRRVPGRPPKAAGLAGLDGIVALVRGLEREVASLRAALARIGEVAARV